MSSEMMIPTQNLPAYMQNYESQNTDSLITSGIFLPRISLRGKQFRFIKDGKEKALPLGAPLEVVILGASPQKGTAKIYFDKPYVEGNDDMPTCSSANGVIPDSWVDQPQCSSCASCPHNQWGSQIDRNGQPTKGKACGDAKQLIVLPPDNPQAEMWSLQVPPTSLKMLTSYGNELKRYKIGVECVVTKIEFVDAEYPKVSFGYAGFIRDDLGHQYIERAQSEEVQSYIVKLAEEPIGPAVTPASQPETQPQPASATAEHQKTSAELVNAFNVLGTGQIDANDQRSEPQRQAAPQSQTAAPKEQFTPQPSAPVRDQSKAVPVGDGSYWVDEFGTSFDSNVHSTKTGCRGGALKADGSFKARRSIGKNQQETPSSNTTQSAPQQNKATPQPSNTQQPANSVFEDDIPFGGGNTQAVPQSTQPAQQQPAAQPDTDQSELQSILDQWGAGG